MKKRHFNCAGFFLLALLSSAVGFSSSVLTAPVPKLGKNADQGPLTITADKLEYSDKERIATYTGHVVATYGQTTLKAEKMKIFFEPLPSQPTAKSPAKEKALKSLEEGKEIDEISENTSLSSMHMKRMEASGHVILLHEDQVGTGDRGIYDRTANTIILTGNASIGQGSNVTQGEELIYNITTGEARMQGKVRSSFMPRSSDLPKAEKGKSVDR